MLRLALKVERESPISDVPPHPQPKRYGPAPDKEGWIEWEVFPKLWVKTYFRIHGTIHQSKGEDGLDPIILLHGGPGAPHELLLHLLSFRETGRTVIFYDQLGCGRSSWLDDDPRYQKLWERQTWVDELKAVVDALDLQKAVLFGHSWGGALALNFAVEHHLHVSGLILCSSLAVGEDFRDNARARLAELPWEMQKAVYEAEKQGHYDTEAYEAAAAEFTNRFVGNVNELTEGDLYSLGELKKDRSRVYRTTWGASEFSPDGNLLHQSPPSPESITVPVLILWGSQDEACASQVNLYNSLTGTKDKSVEIIQGAKHVGYVDHGKEYTAAVAKFLKGRE